MYLSHVPHDGIFLCINETLQHDSDSHVNIVTVHILPQVHSGVGFSNSNYGLDVSHCDGDTTSSLEIRHKFAAQERMIYQLI